MTYINVLEMHSLDIFFKHTTSVSAQTNQLNKCTNQAVQKVRIKICGMLRTILT